MAAAACRSLSRGAGCVCAAACMSAKAERHQPGRCHRRGRRRTQSRVRLWAARSKSPTSSRSADAPASARARSSSTFVDADDELMWTDDHDPPTPTTAVEAGPDGRIHAARCSCRCIRTSGRAEVIVGLYDTASTQARLKLAGADAGERSYQVARTRAAAADREHLPDLQGWLASGRGRAGAIRRSSGSGPRRKRRWRSATRKRDAMLYLAGRQPGKRRRRRQQVEVRIGDQVHRHRPGRGRPRRRCARFRSPRRSSAPATWWSCGWSPTARSCPRSSRRPRATTRASSACASSTPSCSQVLRAAHRNS